MNPATRQKLILDMITLSGPVTSHIIAEALGLDAKVVSGVCQALKAQGYLHSTEEEPRPPRRHTLKIWSVTPPVQRYRKVPDTVGIDADDLAWMQHYRQRAAERQQRRATV